jgi:hypothetical protein
MNETRNTESQISTRGLDSEMEKKMTQREIDKMLKGLDVDTAHEMKFCFEILESFGIDFAKDGEKVLKATKKLKYVA